MTPMSAKTTIILQNRISELERLRDAIQEFAEKHGVPSEAAFDINLALEELLTNIINYGYTDDAIHEIRLTIQKGRHAVRLDLEDDGVPFDPTKLERPDVDQDISQRKIGGLGIFLVGKLMDSTSYRRESNRNIIVLSKTVKKWEDKSPA